MGTGQAIEEIPEYAAGWQVHDSINLEDHLLPSRVACAKSPFLGMRGAPTNSQLHTDTTSSF